MRKDVGRHVQSFVGQGCLNSLRDRMSGERFWPGGGRARYYGSVVAELGDYRGKVLWYRMRE